MQSGNEQHSTYRLCQAASNRMLLIHSMSVEEANAVSPHLVITTNHPQQFFRLRRSAP